MKIVIFSKIAENKRVFDDFWVFLWVFCVFLEFLLFYIRLLSQLFLFERKRNMYFSVRTEKYEKNRKRSA